MKVMCASSVVLVVVVGCFDPKVSGCNVPSIGPFGVVPCTTGSDCGGTTCGSDGVCTACTSDSACDSGVCGLFGDCADPSEVAYVSQGGGGSDCTEAAPCSTITTAIATQRPYVVISGTIYDNVILNGQENLASEELIGSGNAAVVSATGGPTLSVVGADNHFPLLEVKRLTISNGGIDQNSVGIQDTNAMILLDHVTITGNQGGGIAMSGGTAHISSSTITNNVGGGIRMIDGSLQLDASTIAENQGGGIELTSSTFEIESNYIVRNGGKADTDLVGGVLVRQLADADSEDAASVLAFNTITGNAAGMNQTSGVACEAVDEPVIFDSNIIYANDTLGTGTQFGGATCAATYSDIGGGAPGTGNFDADPQFVHLRGDYHLLPTSPCIGRGDPTPTFFVYPDFDGDPRPAGSADVGADQVTD